jgi:hypothetical protein
MLVTLAGIDISGILHPLKQYWPIVFKPLPKSILASNELPEKQYSPNEVVLLGIVTSASLEQP